MVQLGTRRTALVLYGVLLVLPTLVLGGLHWRQLALDHTTQLEAVPRGVADAARRLSVALLDEVNALLESESRRVPFEYRRRYFPPAPLLGSIGFYTSPLSSEPRPLGILGWFQTNTHERSRDPEIQVGFETDEEAAEAMHEDLLGATRDFAALKIDELMSSRLRRVPNRRTATYPVPVAAINLSSEEDLKCLSDEAPALRVLERREVTAEVYDFEVRLFHDSRGVTRIVATRIVNFESVVELDDMPACFQAARRGPEFMQGFFIDPTWLVRDLPLQLSTRLLDPTQELFAGNPGEPAVVGEIVSDTVRPVRALGLVAEDRDQGFGAFRVAVDTGLLRDRFRSQMLHLAGVAAMLVISLATGLVLLLRSVTRDLEAARRTDNFVSAVTHELRTPLSAIRLYGEMLAEGWVADPAKQREYYGRIVRETKRLETLVERVLEKGRLTSNETPVEADDLNRVVEGLRPTLIGPDEDPARDVVFELERELPPVLLYPEGVRSIVGNLVENARKYAPVAEGGEPIRVVTRRSEEDVLLEVLDRGPGIPEAERERIFDAFYRVGNETTRVAKGTGLGLHLVALQAQAMRGRIEVHSRPGGGTIFRVHFVTA
ncbi:MAG: HAMP domain-containing histidine kinase [Planctomycetes bacterium]|nr:HAMP domain-containing histidine kinase [Planctomycetota bacterium]